MVVETYYIPKESFQPTHAGVDEKGEIVWEYKYKEPWHQRMFPVRYMGNFSEQWMWFCLQEKGLGWDD